MSTTSSDDPTRPDIPRTYGAAALVAGERYQVGPSIGRGGMGEVCSAFDSQIGREVAIKWLNSERPTLQELAMFLREARIQGRLQHPSIPPVHELGADAQGRPFFVMKRLSGVSLASVLRHPSAHPTLTRQRLLRAFVEICHAVELAHANRILHRDLKPSNVLLGDLGEVYVIDWGIARELDVTDPVSGVVVGTPGYMAPEQARGDHDLDARGDVYALGCMLHEILTGRPLNPQVRRGSLPSGESASGDDVPPELEPVCRAATAPERSARTESARDLADAVQRYLDGDRDLARRRDLAVGHLASAQIALARSDNEEERRRNAMREAGRALALDPTLGGAAELVGRLMLEPPPITPQVVRDELAAIDRAADDRQLRVAATLNALHVAAIPVMIVLGVRDVAYLAAIGILAFANIASQLGALRSASFKRWGAPLAAVCAMALLALVARVFTPFLLAPGYAAVSLTSFALSSQARDRRVIISFAGMSIAAILAVWLAEELGLLSPTMWIAGGTLVLRSPLDGIDKFPIVPALCFYVFMLIASAASVAHAVSRNQHRSLEQLQVQSWQLRQLL